MKKLIIMLFAVLLLAACGDKTTINGYTDEQVEKLLEANKDTVYQVTDGDSVLTYIYVTDTLYNEIVDTVYKMSVDTLYKTLYDTLSTTIIDTVVNTLVDTIVTRVIDTVINTMVDTIYTRVIDTVFSTLNDVGIDTELLRDTTITLTTTIDGLELSRVYHGKVFNGVFYDTTLYRYAETEYNDRVAQSVAFSYRALGDTKTRTEQYTSNYVSYTMVSQCGAISKPSDGLWQLTYDSRQGKHYDYKTFSGWRLFDDADAYALRNQLSDIIPADSAVYLSDVKRFSGASVDKNGVNNSQYVANVATSTGIKTAIWPTVYMCAYDLK